MTVGPGRITKRAVLVGLVAATAIASTGVGLVAPALDRPSTGSTDGGEGVTTPPNRTPGSTPAGGSDPVGTAATTTPEADAGDGSDDRHATTDGDASDPATAALDRSP